jgi:threonine/homoserine/homoserine lactone efflux protein
MTSLNPMTLAFWLVVVPGVAGQLSRNAAHDLPFLCAGVFVGAFSWVCSFSTLMSLAGRFRKPITLMAADLLGGVMLLAFAAYALYQVVQRFF